MKLLDAKINIFFKDINETNEVIKEIIEGFKKSYKVANLSSVTSDGLEINEDIPHDIPRIVGKSHGGHTQLNICLNRAEIYVSFDSLYANNIEKCIEYVTDKVKEIYDVLNKFVEDRYLFSGIAITQIFDELVEDPVERIKKNFINLKSHKQPYNISSKFTYVVNETHFININISNARGIENIQTDISNSIPKKFNYLSIMFDVNDRYGLNEFVNYSSSYEKMINNISLAKRLCKDEAYHLINGEELNI